MREHQYEGFPVLPCEPLSDPLLFLPCLPLLVPGSWVPVVPGEPLGGLPMVSGLPIWPLEPEVSLGAWPCDPVLPVDPWLPPPAVCANTAPESPIGMPNAATRIHFASRRVMKASLQCESMHRRRQRLASPVTV